MCKAVESLIEVINDNIKNQSNNLQKEINEILNIQNTNDKNNFHKIENINDEMFHSIRTIKKLKMLKNKLNRIKSEIKSLTMYAYKPERIDTDDEEKWMREEKESLIKKLI